MYVGGWDDLSFKLLIPCRTGIVDDDALIYARSLAALMPASPAHVAHRTADHHLVNAVFVEHRLQIRLPKSFIESNIRRATELNALLWSSATAFYCQNSRG